MTLLADTTQTGNLDGYQSVGIHTEDMGHIMSLLSSQYARPKDAVIRELWANGYDSHIEAGVNRPVDITLPTQNHPTLTIRDYGTGMSRDTLERFYCGYGASDKRLSANRQDAAAQKKASHSIGQLGIGSKSPLAVADQFTLTSIHEGHKYHVHLARSANAPTHTIIDAGETDEPNGVSVQVPAEISAIAQWEAAARNVLFWLDKDSFHLTHKLDGLKNHENYVVQRHGLVTKYATLPECVAWQNDQYKVRMRQIVYELPYSIGKSLGLKENAVLEVSDQNIKTTPSRESLEDSRENQRILHDLVTTWRGECLKKTQRRIAAATDIVSQQMALMQHRALDTNITHNRRFIEMQEKCDKALSYGQRHATIDVARFELQSGNDQKAHRRIETMTHSHLINWLAQTNLNPAYVFLTEKVQPTDEPKIRLWLRKISKPRDNVSTLMLWNAPDTELLKSTTLTRTITLDTIRTEVKKYEAEERARRKKEVKTAEPELRVLDMGPSKMYTETIAASALRTRAHEAQHIVLVKHNERQILQNYYHSGTRLVLCTRNDRRIYVNIHEYEPDAYLQGPVSLDWVDTALGISKHERWMVECNREMNQRRDIMMLSKQHYTPTDIAKLLNVPEEKVMLCPDFIDHASTRAQETVDHQIARLHKIKQEIIQNNATAALEALDTSDARHREAVISCATLPSGARSVLQRILASTATQLPQELAQHITEMIDAATTTTVKTHTHALRAAMHAGVMERDSELTRKWPLSTELLTVLIEAKADVPMAALSELARCDAAHRSA